MKYKVGDIIKQRTFLGTHRYVKVTAKHDDIKNGKPGFDGYDLLLVAEQYNHPIEWIQSTSWVSRKACTVWGYDYQVLKVM